MSETVRVNFARPIPIFPFLDVVLMPHETMPLHIFEPRYRTMISHCLDTAGQFAIATIDREADAVAGGAEPRPLRPFACVGQIVGHEPLPDGRFNLLLQGVCRARILETQEPDGDRPYRTATMRAVEVSSEAPLDDVRTRLAAVVHDARLDPLESIERLREWADHAEIPTRAFIDLVGLVLVRDPQRKYALLSEPDVRLRAEMVGGELEHLEQLLAAAAGQSWRDWPRGMSWN
jgi:Lon protease-like protein